MFRTKKDVDRHVQEILRKLKTESERNLRCYNIAKLYYQVGDYESARRYVSSYLEVREESAGAHKLLGQTLEALGQKEAALTQYKLSLELEGRQDDLVLKVCELLADTDVAMDVSRARYWVERADRQFPHHPVVFQLKEKLLTVDRPNEHSEDLEALIASELLARPTDVSLRVKLLVYYMEKNRLEDAYKHASGVEATHPHRNSTPWYQALCELLPKCKEKKQLDWSFWILYISALERFAALSLKEQGDGHKRTVPEAAQAVFNFDQSLTEMEQRKFSNNPTIDYMFTHMWGQLHFHLACLLLRKTKREQGSWNEAGRLCGPLLLVALHVNPVEPDAVLWTASKKDEWKSQTQLWYKEGSYRCSQAGHVLQDYARGDTKRFLSKIDKFCTSTWRERVYQRIFVSRVHQQLIGTSYFTHHSTPNPPLRLCSQIELKHYDEVSEEVWPASLHHQIWLGVKSRFQNSTKKDNSPHPHQYSHVFSELQLSVYNLNQAAPDSLCRLDVDAFLNAAVLCASVVVEERQRSGFFSPDMLPTLPADLTNTLSTCAQEKWWSSAYKMYREQETIGGDIGEIRQILQRGLEVIRCIGNHGLHPAILVHLARIFQYRVKVLKEKDGAHVDIPPLEARSELYWSAAVPLLERLQNNQTIRTNNMKLFDYQGKEMNNVELTNALEEGRLLLALRYSRDEQHEQAIDALQALKCPEASFQQGQIYKKLADELVSSLPRESLTSEMRSQHIIMLSKARDCFYLTLDRLRSPGTNPKHPLNSELSTHISAIENELKRIDPDLWRSDLNRNDYEGLSDESYSSAHSGVEQPAVNASSVGLGSSLHISNTPHRSARRTPKQSSTPYKPQHQDIMELSRSHTEARPSPERLDAQIRQLIHSRDNVLQAVLEQNKALLESHKTLLEQLEDVKKEIADLRKENQKQRAQTSSVNQNLEEELYVFGDEDYGDLNYGTSAQPSAGSAPAYSANTFAQSQRHVNAYSPFVYQPAAALQNYYQSGLQFADPSIPPLYQPGVYPMPALYPRPAVDQPIGQLPKLPDNAVPQNIFAPRLPNQLPEHASPASQALQARAQKIEATRNEVAIKDAPVDKAPPVNVVITTSDTLPTTAPSAQPTLSVTIPPHHRLGGTSAVSSSAPVSAPHNYQISMPSQATIPTTVNLPSLSTAITTTVPSYGATFSANINEANASTASTGSVAESPDRSLEAEHDPIPDFQPVIPLPAEVEVTTGEEDETTLYCARAKLFRFVDKEWKERGVGNVKLLKNAEGKVRLLMRREQVLKICANHMLRPDMELTAMPTNEKAWMWVANDFADEKVRLEKLCIKFKTVDEALRFKDSFDEAKSCVPSMPEVAADSGATATSAVSEATGLQRSKSTATVAKNVPTAVTAGDAPVVVGGFSFTSKPKFQEAKADTTKAASKQEDAQKASPFVDFSFTKTNAEKPATNFSAANSVAKTTPANAKPAEAPSPSPVFSFVKTTVATTPISFSFKKQPVSSAAPSPITTAQPAAPSPVQTQPSGNVSPSVNIFSRTPLRRPHAPAPAEIAAASAGENISVTTSTSVDKPGVESKDDDAAPAEDFVPTAEFTPAVSLPDIVEVITGEEGESILFEQRSKLLRFDSTAKQWKERGVGQMKILLDPKSGKVRLLMRREQVLKVCCNHTLLAETKFTFKSGTNTVVNWFAHDYSEEKVKPEMFAIKFKTPEQASEFHDTIANLQSTMINDRMPTEKIPQKIQETQSPSSNDVKLQTTTAKKTNAEKPPLSQLFKPAADSWECSACYVTNGPSDSQCIACNSPKSGTTTTTTTTSAQKPPLSQLFKPAANSWECSACYVTNGPSDDRCVACNSPKSGSTMPRQKSDGFKASAAASTPAVPFSTDATEKQKPLSDLFRPPANSWECGACYTRNDSTKTKCAACEAPAPNAVANQSDSAIATPGKESLSQAFKRSPGTWECQSCSIVNSASNNYCVTCDTAKDPAMPPKPKGGGFAVSSGPSVSFSFGIPKGSTKEATTGGFTFGVPKTDLKAAGDSAKTPETRTFGTAAKADDSTAKFVFGIPKQDTASSSPFTFGSPGKSFDFHFQARSPVKSPGGGETSEDEVAESDDVYFPPAIPLPDKIDIKTGEEDEEVLYSHRAKLFRFDTEAKAWKERGLGDIKLLKHNVTGKLRLVMRRDQVLKLCLNHIVLPDLELTSKDDKTWLWSAADYSEGEIEHEQFACRFKTREIADEFKRAIDDAKKPATTPAVKIAPKSIVKSPETIKKNLFGEPEELRVLYELKVTPEEKAAALKLQLPENFYAYKRKPDCAGCIGCRDESVSLFGSASKEASAEPAKKDQSVASEREKSSASLTFGDSTKVREPKPQESKQTASRAKAPTITFGANVASSGVKTAEVASTTVTTASTSVIISPPVLGSGFASKPNISFKPSPSATSSATFAVPPVAVSSATVAGSTATVFGDKKNGGMIFGIGASGQANSNAAVSGSNAGASSAINTFSFASANKAVPTFGEQADAKTIENLNACSPLNLSSKTTSASATSIFGGAAPLSFGSGFGSEKSIFGGTASATPVFGTTGQTSVFGSAANAAGKSLFGGTTFQGDTSSVASTTNANIFRSPGTAMYTNIFGGSPKTVASTATTTTTTPTTGNVSGTPGKVLAPPLFGSFAGVSSFGSITGQSNASSTETASSTLGSAANKPSSTIFGGTVAPVFGVSPTNIASKLAFGSTITGAAPSTFGSANNVFGSKTKEEEAGKDNALSFLPTDNVASFSALAASSQKQQAFNKDPNFSFDGAGSSVFGSKPAANAPSPAQTKKGQLNTSKKEEDDDEEGEEADDGQEHDPHFEPVIPLPDAIEVRTGEEDETKVFCQRAKLYRYVNATREWKERGVGEMKILHHVEHGTYRLLLRREQVHKVVCNILLTPDINFGMLNSSDRAWCWAGMNYAEDDPVVEELAIKFKTPEQALQFKEVIDSAQKVLLEKQNIDQEGGTEDNESGVQGEEEDEDIDEEEEEDEDESLLMFEKRATLFTQDPRDSTWKNIAMGDLKVFYDSEIFGARIVLEIDGTGEFVSNTIISMQTSMQVQGKECIWSEIDYALDPPVKRTLKAVFSSVQVAGEMLAIFEDGQHYAKQAGISESEYYMPDKE